MFGRSTPTHKRKPSSGQFYFVSHNPGTTESVRDAGDNVDVIDMKGTGSLDEEFRPKPVNRNLVKGPSMMKQSPNETTATAEAKPNPLSRALFAMFGRRQPTKKPAFNVEGAKKVDAKLFFANERTFLKWMNVSIWVAGISIGLSSVATPGSLDSLAVLFFSAIAIVIVCYSMVQYGKRSLMILKRSPGPYEDRYGPLVIGSLFVLSFTVHYCIYMASLSNRY